MPDTLTNTVDTAHRMLQTAMEEASFVAFPRLARDTKYRVDSFLIAANRHLTAVMVVLFDEIRTHSGAERAKEMAHETHLLEVALCRAKARLSGSSALMKVPWSQLWTEVQDGFERVCALERVTVNELADALGPDQLMDLATRMCRAEERAPTRPHPFLPHRGMAGSISRFVAARADSFWDGVEGRIRPPATPLVPETPIDPAIDGRAS